MKARGLGVEEGRQVVDEEEALEIGDDPPSIDGESMTPNRLKPVVGVDRATGQPLHPRKGPEFDSSAHIQASIPDDHAVPLVAGNPQAPDAAGQFGTGNHPVRVSLPATDEEGGVSFSRKKDRRLALVNAANARFSFTLQ